MFEFSRLFDVRLWLLLFLSFLLGGCAFHGKGVTEGKRVLELGFYTDTGLRFTTDSEGDKAQNEEWLGIEWTGPPPPATP